MPANTGYPTQKKRYILLAVLIIILSLLLRFYKFDSLWGLSTDETRDALIALESIKRRDLPLIGSFSSAGPFVFGPLFYWFIMASYIILPGVVNGPWIITSMLSTVTVIILLLCARSIGSLRFSLITGLLAAYSPQLVLRSKALNQHTQVALWSALGLLFFLKLAKNKRPLYAYLCGLAIGIAINMHYQALNLLIFTPFILLITNIKLSKKFIYSILFIVGVLTASIPIILWDINQNFANYRNLLDYLLIGQYRIYVPNSWRLFMFEYFPSYWSLGAGGLKPIALFLIALTGVTFLIKTVTGKVSNNLLILGMIFFLLSFINKFYKGERFEGYLIYLLPLVILFTSWSLYEVIKYNRYSYFLGIFLVFVVFWGNTILVKRYYRESDNSLKEINASINQLTALYPNQKFKVYNYTIYNSEKGFTLGLLLNFRDKLDPNGQEIGICHEVQCPKSTIQILNFRDFKIVVANKADNYEEFTNSQWFYSNPAGPYEDLIGWSKSNKLTSTYRFFWEQ